MKGKRTFDRDLSVPILRLATPLPRAGAIASLPALGSPGEALVAVRAELEEGRAVPDVELREGGAGREGREQSRRAEVDAGRVPRLGERVVRGQWSDDGPNGRSGSGGTAELDGTREARSRRVEGDAPALPARARGFSEGGEVEVGSGVLRDFFLGSDGGGPPARSLLEIGSHDLRGEPIRVRGKLKEKGERLTGGIE